MDEYVSQMEEAYISTPEMDEDTREALNSMREMLGLMDGVSDTGDQEDEQAAEPHLKLADEAEAAPES